MLQFLVRSQLDFLLDAVLVHKLEFSIITIGAYFERTVRLVVLDRYVDIVARIAAGDRCRAFMHSVYIFCNGQRQYQFALLIQHAFDVDVSFVLLGLRRIDRELQLVERYAAVCFVLLRIVDADQGHSLFAFALLQFARQREAELIVLQSLMLQFLVRSQLDFLLDAVRISKLNLRNIRVSLRYFDSPVQLVFQVYCDLMRQRIRRCAFHVRIYSLSNRVSIILLSQRLTAVGLQVVQIIHDLSKAEVCT